MHPIAGPAADVMARLRPEILVIDDPSAAAARVWCETARRAGIPVASVHDLGTAFCGADLTIDGSIVRLRRRGAAAGRPGRLLAGVRYTVLDEALQSARPTRTPASSVLIALGGGPRHGVARRLALAIREARPELRIRVAGGFGRTDARDADGITWLGPQRGLASELASCGVAITGGGVSLYEAVTLRTPVVAWPVVRAQMPTVEAFGRKGLAAAVMPGPRRLERAVNAVLSAIDSGGAARPHARRHGFDGRGAKRAASAIRSLARQASEVRA
jgi:spore coat polysaccharide biosynthesis predicted glycosyltransferase SpsG